MFSYKIIDILSLNSTLIQPFVFSFKQLKETKKKSFLHLIGIGKTTFLFYVRLYDLGDMEEFHFVCISFLHRNIEKKKNSFNILIQYCLYFILHQNSLKCFLKLLSTS